MKTFPPLEKKLVTDKNGYTQRASQRVEEKRRSFHLHGVLQGCGNIFLFMTSISLEAYKQQNQRGEHIPQQGTRGFYIHAHITHINIISHHVQDIWMVGSWGLLLFCGWHLCTLWGTSRGVIRCLACIIDRVA